MSQSFLSRLAKEVAVYGPTLVERALTGLDLKTNEGERAAMFRLDHVKIYASLYCQQGSDHGTIEEGSEEARDT